MRSLTIGSLVLLGVSLYTAQAAMPGPVFVGAGFANPFPIAVGVSATFWNGSADEAMPVLQVNQTNAACTGSTNTACANLLAVTVQIPFDAPAIAVSGSNIAVVPSSIAVAVNGVKSSYFGVQPAPDQVHLLLRPAKNWLRTPPVWDKRIRRSPPDNRPLKAARLWRLSI